MTDVRAVAIDLDALSDTHALWSDWLASARAVLGVEPAALPVDRGKAAAELDSGGSGQLESATAALQRGAGTGLSPPRR